MQQSISTNPSSPLPSPKSMVTPLKPNPDVTVGSPNSAYTMKFLYSYEGKILPRYPDGKLRYHGGQTRVLAVDRLISFSELLLKLGGSYRPSIILRCQLPEEDLDALVSIRSDEDLKNIVEEYEFASHAAGVQLMIRAFLWRPKTINKRFQPPSETSPVVDYRNSKKLSYQPFGSGFTKNHLVQMVPTSIPLGIPLCFNQPMSIRRCYYTGVPQGIQGPSHHIHHRNLIN